MAAANSELYFLTIHQAGELIRNGELSPVELTRACLERIDHTDDRLHSFILLTADDALRDARVAESEVLSGNYRGPMHGIPFALKDLYDTAGVRTTSGSEVDIDRVPTEDATTTARLKAAGGILLGKLAMHEFALGGPDWTTPFEPARNPWNLDHITGAVQQRVWLSRRVRPVPGGVGFVHWRLHSWAGFSVRHRRTQANLRPRESLRSRDSELVSGPRRSDDLDSGGHGVHASGNRRARSKRSNFEPSSSARLLSIFEGGHQGGKTGTA